MQSGRSFARSPAATSSSSPASASAALALSALLDDRLLAQDARTVRSRPRAPHFAPKAKTIIYLFMAGAPTQLDLFDNKPALQEHDGQEIPSEFIPKGERFAFIKGTPRLLGSPFTFKRYGQSGAELSELLPHLATIADDIAIVRSVHTTQFNHAPGQIFMNTGSQVFGRPSMGSWLTYGLGSESRDLPGFIVLLSGENAPDGGKSCWGSGFLPTVYQGVEFRSKGDPVLFVSNPDGVDASARRESIDLVTGLNQLQRARGGRSGDRYADRVVRDGVSDAEQRAGADGHLRRARRHPRDVRHRARQGLVRQQLSARATPDRARRALRAALSPRLGHARRERRHRHRQSRARALPRDRSRRDRAGLRSETARPARHDARRLGRRVRAHADERGAQRLAADGARPSSARVHRSGWPAAASSRASRSAGPTISATTSSKIPSKSTTSTPRSCT